MPQPNSKPLPQAPEEIRTPSLFERCYGIDIQKITRKNYQGIDYISWADAWALLKTHFPDAAYAVSEFPTERSFKNGGLEEAIRVPYLKTEAGTFVEVAVTIEGVTMAERLPVMDGAMKVLEVPDARDINDNTKRCLVKAMALHGFGLSVYEKDDVYAREKAETKTQTHTHKYPSQAPSSRGVGAVNHPPAKGGEFRFGFGKFQGKTFAEIPMKELKSYLNWMHDQDAMKPGSAERNEPIYQAFEAFEKAAAMDEDFDPKPFGEKPPPESYEDIPL